MSEAKGTPSVCGQRTVRIIFYFASCCASQSTFYDQKCSEEKHHKEADVHSGLKAARPGGCHLTEMKAMSLCSREHNAVDCCGFSSRLLLRVSTDLCDRQSEHRHNSLCRDFA